MEQNKILYLYLNEENSQWIEEILLSTEILQLGDLPHPIDLLFQLTSHFEPSLLKMPITYNNPRNILKSKLRKIKDIFIILEIKSPLQYYSLIEFNENDETYKLNYNLIISSLRNYFLIKEFNELILEQHLMIKQMRELKKESDIYRIRLQKSLNLIENNNNNLPFSEELISLITKEPSCFKPL